MAQMRRVDEVTVAQMTSSTQPPTKTPEYKNLWYRATTSRTWIAALFLESEAQGHNHRSVGSAFTRARLKTVQRDSDLY